MKTLITGVSGGLGRTALETLLAAGDAVRATARRRAEQLGAWADAVDYVPADLTRLDPTTLRALLTGVDVVWHCAALSSPWGRYRDFYAANTQATTDLARAAIQYGVRRFVHISTPSIYFDYRHHHDVVESYRPRRFVNAYAATKMLAEDAIRDCAVTQSETRFVILRPRALFGPHDRAILPRVLKLLARYRGHLPLPRGGRALVDLTYLENAVHAMRCATTAAVPSGAAFNITNQAPSTLRDVLDDLLRCELGLKFTSRNVPYPLLALAANAMQGVGALTGREPLMTRYSAAALHYDMTLSNAQARGALNYVPPISMAQGIHLTARWLHDHGHIAGL